MRKNVGANQARRTSPMWYTAATDYAQKRRLDHSMSLGPTTNNSRPLLRGFVGQGNRLESGPTSFAPLAERPGTTMLGGSYPPHRRRLRTSRRNLFLAPVSSPVVKARSPSPYVMDMQSSVRVLQDLELKQPVQLGSKVPARSDKAEVPPKSSLDPQVGGKASNGNVQPLIMVEPLIKQKAAASADEKSKPAPTALPSSKAASESQSERGEASTAGAQPQQAGSAAEASEPSEAPSNTDNSEGGRKEPLVCKISKCNCAGADGAVPECQIARVTGTAEVQEEVEVESEVGVVAACEVTEAHYISFDCGKVGPNAPDRMDVDGCQSNYWNSAPQFYMPPFNDRPQPAVCASKAFGCPHCQPASRMGNNRPCGKCGWNRSSYMHHQKQPQQQQQYQHGCPSQHMHQCSCCSMCGQQRQVVPMCPVSNSCHPGGLTELLAQQLQKQMQQAQAQIEEVQMQLNTVCASSNRQSQLQALPELPNGRRHESTADPAYLNDFDAAVDQEEQQPRQYPVVSVGNGSASAPGEPMALGLYALPESIEPHGPYYDVPPSARFPASPQQQQQQQLQQQQQQHHFQQAQQCPIQFQQHQQQPQLYPQPQYAQQHQQQQPCCRQRYAKMRFMMPRYWQGGQ